MSNYYDQEQLTEVRAIGKDVDLLQRQVKELADMHERTNQLLEAILSVILPEDVEP